MMKSARSALKLGKKLAEGGPLLQPFRGLSGVVRCDLPDVDIPNLTFHDMCWSNIEKNKEKVALVRIFKNFFFFATVLIFSNLYF